MNQTTTPNKDNSTVTNFNEAANDIKNDVQNFANKAGHKVRSLYNSASEEITHASDSVTTEIRSNPIRSTAIALGAGVILGMLLRR